MEIYKSDIILDFQQKGTISQRTARNLGLQEDGDLAKKHNLFASDISIGKQPIFLLSPKLVIPPPSQ